MSSVAAQNTWVDHLARFGLSAKGIVYCMLGFVAFKAAFELGGQSGANRNDALMEIRNWPLGQIILAIITAGLFCYSLWRIAEAFVPGQKKWFERVRYGISGLTYLTVAIAAFRVVMDKRSEGGDNNQQLAGRLMQEEYGPWILGALALVFAGVGIYQLIYAYSEKYKKHVQGLRIHSNAHILLRSGKIGYTARGIVWLIVAWLLMRAALHQNASEAGDTDKAFQFIESATAGSAILGAIGLGLIAYGIFSFLRARYERFH